MVFPLQCWVVPGLILAGYGTLFPVEHPLNIPGWTLESPSMGALVPGNPAYSRDSPQEDLHHDAAAPAVCMCATPP